MTNDEYMVERHATDLELMRHPERWPNRELPLKRYRPQAGGHLQVDFSLLAKPARDFYHWIPEISVGTFDPTGGRVGGDELLVDLIKLGWLVD